MSELADKTVRDPRWRRGIAIMLMFLLGLWVAAFSIEARSCQRTNATRKTIVRLVEDTGFENTSAGKRVVEAFAPLDCGLPWPETG